MEKDGAESAFNELSGIRERIPAEIDRYLEQNLGDHDIAAALSSDIGLDGRYADSWLIVTDEHIISFDSSYSREAPVYILPLTEIDAIRMRSFFGNGVIEVSTSVRTFDIIRFTNTCSNKFHKGVKRINELVRSVRPDAVIDESVGLQDGENAANRCRKCGKSLPTGLRLCPDCINKKETFLRLIGYVKPYPLLWFSTILLSLAFTVTSLIPAYLPKYLIDEGLMKQNLAVLKLMVAALLLTHIVSRILDGLRGYYLNMLGQKVLLDLRRELYNHLQTLSPSFYDKRQTGAIMARVIGDVNQLTNFLSQGIQNIIIQFLTAIVIGFILLQADWRMGLMALSPTPLVFFGTKMVNKRLRKIWHLVRRRGAELNAILGDTLPGIKVVKAFGREDDEVDKFVAKQMQLYDSHMMAATLSRKAYPAISFTVALGAVLIWAYGGYMVIKGFGLPPETPGIITLGEFVLFNGYMWRLFMPIQQLSQLSGQLQQAATSAERIFEILDTPPDIIDDHEPIIHTDMRGEIVFENVSFGYEPDEEILKDINLRIEPGEMIGLVGSSGAGKTTLVNLLSRFYDATAGVIKIDRIPINKLQIRTLRDQIAVVLQEPFLFHATIAENIAYGRADATKEEIIWAANMANAHGFIVELPEGYDTRLGERGTGLSGGQKQRISIARAILRDPKILILDEATSSVDTETERLIQEALDRLVKGRTTIAIAHRLSTLRNADRIIVMENGRIVEMGTHEELMKANGIFNSLVKMQSELAKRSII